jgi:hypothetical protein
MASIEARHAVFEVLRRELVGPDPQGEPFDGDAGPVDESTAWMPRRQAASGEEILTRDGPDRRYGIGVLYSRAALARGDEVTAGEGPPETPGEDTGPDLITRTFQTAAAQAQDGLGGEPAGADMDLDLSGANEYRPTTMAVSFLAELPTGAVLTLYLQAGRYQEREIAVGTRARAWWFRSPCALEAAWQADDLRYRAGWCRPATTATNLDGLDVRAFAVSRPRGDGTSLITAGIMNLTPGTTPNHFLFQVAFKLSLSDAPVILPYPEPEHSRRDREEESIDLLYRRVPTFAVGHGCAAGWVASGQPGRCSEVSAEPLPVVDTPSITPEVRRPNGTDLKVPMAPLAGLVRGDDGLGSLSEVIDLYEEWIQAREAESLALGENHRRTAIRHLGACRDLAARMKAGLELISNDGPAREAFMLANRAVLLQQVHSVGTTRELAYDARLQAVRFSQPRRPADPLSPPPGRGAWRPFQVAFLLAAMPSCAGGSHPDRDVVELLFFPTGGGKTEAYLGLSAFSIFLRRLRDPADVGVEVLMRYTLRLLTAQQFQRAASLVCAMETIRTSHGGLGQAPFTIGIWVGGDTAPNTRKEALEGLRELRAGNAPNPFLVIRCPWCAAQVGPLKEQGRRGRDTGRGPRVLGYDESDRSVRISCTDNTCEFSGGLPVFVIDEDIYEHRPSIVIGTVDKFAQLAWRADARSLFGLGPSGVHEVSPPRLIIQDELHLISGPLGSMVGLYEAAIERLCTDRRGGEPVPPKIVSSTATIRRYEDQVRALFARERVALFPPHGIDAADSFFARYATYPPGHPRAGEVREGRMYVGIHGGGLGSLQTAQVRTFAALLQAGMDLPEQERDPYWTLMVFFNSLRELGTSLSLLQSDIPDYMKVIRNRRGSSWDEVRRLNREMELTSRLQNDDVPQVMEALTVPYGQGKDAVDVCLASNIIEVGIDIERLSLMAVVGQPKSTSQYIQVTGRVGRRWEDRPGLIATIYSPTKPRDRSHYEKFRSYHERLYAQVEPTSVTPFAPPVLARAVHAVIVSWVRQRLDVAPASSPYPVPLDAIEEAAGILRRRVSTVDPEEAASLDTALARRVGEWQRWLPGEWRRASPGAEPGLLYAAGEYADPEERVRSWATPVSMRNVDAECQGVITGIYALETPGDTP